MGRALSEAPRGVLRGLGARSNPDHRDSWPAWQPKRGRSIRAPRPIAGANT